VTKLWIGNLHWGTTAAKLQAFLEAWKLHPEGLELQVDIDGISKRFAFAYVPAHEVDAALKLSGKNVDSTPIKVAKAGDYRGPKGGTRQRKGRAEPAAKTEELFPST